jgi:hypothetical protein
MPYLNFNPYLDIGKLKRLPADLTNTVLAPYGDAALNAGASLLNVKRRDPNALENAARESLGESVAPIAEGAKSLYQGARSAAIAAGAEPVGDLPAAPKAPAAAAKPAAASGFQPTEDENFQPPPTLPGRAVQTPAQVQTQPQPAGLRTVEGAPGVFRQDQAGQNPLYFNLPQPAPATAPAGAAGAVEPSLTQQYLDAARIYQSTNADLRRERLQLPQLGGGGIFSAMQGFTQDAANFAAEAGKIKGQTKSANRALKNRKTESDIATQERNAASLEDERAATTELNRQKSADAKEVSALRRKYLELNDQNDPNGAQRLDIERKMAALAGKTRDERTIAQINAAKAILADPFGDQDSRATATQYLSSVLSTESGKKQPAAGLKVGEKTRHKDGQFEAPDGRIVTFKDGKVVEIK